MPCCVQRACVAWFRRGMGLFTLHGWTGVAAKGGVQQAAGGEIRIVFEESMFEESMFVGVKHRCGSRTPRWERLRWRMLPLTLTTSRATSRCSGCLRSSLQEGVWCDAKPYTVCLQHTRSRMPSNPCAHAPAHAQGDSQTHVHTPPRELQQRKQQQRSPAHLKCSPSGRASVAHTRYGPRRFMSSNCSEPLRNSNTCGSRQRASCNAIY